MQRSVPEPVKFKQNTFYLAQRRIAEMVAAFVLIILLLPLCCIISLVIWLQDQRPIFFRQVRTGKNGRPFVMWKFRTMKETTPAAESETLSTWNAGVPDSFVFKSCAQQGLTKTGAFLRKYSLDELPQLINVLRGEMSFIGPRPEVPKITARYNAYQEQRLTVPPGITGLAQISGRSNMDHGQKIQYDLHYIQHCGLLLDMKIILLTIITVCKANGAY